MIRRCTDDDVPTILEIINVAAEAYRGVIPNDCWHEPYMPAKELARDIAGGVAFWGWQEAGSLVGVMGLQPVEDVVLIRHAYVRPDRQRQGIGAALLAHLAGLTDKPLLVGTWATAGWAVRFYERHGFTLVDTERKNCLLRRYWSVPDRQVSTSVVLADERWLEIDAIR